MFKGVTYYMDIVLRMGAQQVLCEGPRKGYQNGTHVNHQFFGCIRQKNNDVTPVSWDDASNRVPIGGFTASSDISVYRHACSIVDFKNDANHFLVSQAPAGATAYGSIDQRYGSSLRGQPFGHPVNVAPFSHLSASSPRQGSLYLTSSVEEDGNQGAGENGRHRWEPSQLETQRVLPIQDPAYAPYTPPYFYGESILRVKFTPSSHTTDTNTVALEWLVKEVTNAAQTESQLIDRYDVYDGVTDTFYPTLTNPITTADGPFDSGLTPRTASLGFAADKSRMKAWDPQGGGVLNPFEVVRMPQITSQFNPDGSVVPDSVQESNDVGDDVWVIEPKWECPVLDFSGTLDPISGDTKIPFYNEFGEIKYRVNNFHDYKIGKGLWSGYGYDPYDTKLVEAEWRIQKSSARPNLDKGIYIELRDSFPDSRNRIISYGEEKVEVQNKNGHVTQVAIDDLSNNDVVGSLIDVCGFTTDSKPIGKLARSKEISEAVVAIPFMTDFNPRYSSDPSRFFSFNDGTRGYFAKIAPQAWSAASQYCSSGQFPSYFNDLGKRNQLKTSPVYDLAVKMKKFVLPPEFDFYHNRLIDPFVMYIFDFNHTLSKQELTDIWQNVMPQSSLKAEKATSIITHNVGINEFDFFYSEGSEAFLLDFGSDEKPNDSIKWLVFKIKQRANYNYYNLTMQAQGPQITESSTDGKFATTTPVYSNELMGIDSHGPQKYKEPPFSYNWPYDYFSLVELVKIDTETFFEKRN